MVVVVVRHCDLVRAPLDELLVVEMMSRAADI